MHETSNPSSYPLPMAGRGVVVVNQANLAMKRTGIVDCAATGLYVETTGGTRRAIHSLTLVRSHNM